VCAVAAVCGCSAAASSAPRRAGQFFTRNPLANPGWITQPCSASGSQIPATDAQPAKSSWVERENGRSTNTDHRGFIGSFTNPVLFQDFAKVLVDMSGEFMERVRRTVRRDACGEQPQLVA
jgi:hypothetical protein